MELIQRIRISITQRSILFLPSQRRLYRSDGYHSMAYNSGANNYGAANFDSRSNQVQPTGQHTLSSDHRYQGGLIKIDQSSINSNLRSNSQEFKNLIRTTEHQQERPNQILIQPGTICFETSPGNQFNGSLSNSRIMSTSTPRSTQGARPQELSRAGQWQLEEQATVRQTGPAKGEQMTRLPSSDERSTANSVGREQSAYASERSEELLQMKDMHALLLHRECQSLAAKVIKLEKELADKSRAPPAPAMQDKATGTDFIPSEYSSVQHCSEDQENLGRCNLL